MSFKEEQVIALIPARSGSKGIRHKNLHPLNGKPLIQYAVEASLGSLYIDRTFVSSDSDEILHTAKKMNSEVIVRPSDLAMDDSSIVDTIQHCIETLGLSSGIIILLQPTSPLRTTQHIDDAFNLLGKHDTSNLVSVFELKHTPFKSYIINDSYLEPLIGREYLNKNRQELPSAYQANGAIYIFSIRDFCSMGEIPKDSVVPFVMNREDSIDIDTLDDIDTASRFIEIKEKAYVRA